MQTASVDVGQTNVFYMELAAWLRSNEFKQAVSEIKSEEMSLIAPQEQPVSPFAEQFVQFLKEQ